MSDGRRRDDIDAIWRAAVAAVEGRAAVARALAEEPDFRPDLVLAVGKAAAGMSRAALAAFPGCETLVVTKYHHGDEELRARPEVTLIEAAHPVPDGNSLRAGQLLLERVAAVPPGGRLLLLVSGGASALAEALVDGFDLERLRAETDALIAGGKTIAEINRRRKQVSRIKDGKLLEAFRGAEARVYAISDVEGDGIDVIGSGIGDIRRAPGRATVRLVASNAIARAAAARAAEQRGYPVVVNAETLYGDLFELAPVLGRTLAAGTRGVYIWGGEPTVVLPPNPGRGGRNQSLALALAREIAGRDDIAVLVAGTDGTDGPTDAAGGIVDGATWRAPDAEQALAAADAGPYLERRGALLVTGPTHTNVMDLVIAVLG